MVLTTALAVAEVATTAVLRQPAIPTTLAFQQTARPSLPAALHLHLMVLPRLNLSRPVPGGRLANAGVDPQAEKRLQELEEQKRKLLDAIDEKQAVKRKAVREWERGEQEVKRDGLKSELAEGSLEALTGEGGGVGAAF
ncbi:MAG: hypothetical protein LQ344_001170 [Seirophora lacunosa]|nr:MAG: hypothetical protein LQ344_001170 [Seirophora lacunosa]